MSQFRKVHRILAFLSFLIPFIAYCFTGSPSISFGESGSLAAAAYYQQVPSAPGAPLWIAVAGSFVKLLPGDPAHLLTIFSSLCGALTVMIVYLLVVVLINSSLLRRDGTRDEGGGMMDARKDEEERRRDDEETGIPFHHRYAGGIEGLLGGVIAALSFAWFDSQWSNATQITIRSAGTLIVALVLWLGMRWYHADREGEGGSFRWLLLAAYVAGLSLGVDHLALDVIPSILMILWVRRIVPEGEEGRYALGAFLAMVGLLLLRYALGSYASYAFIPFLAAAVIGAVVAATVPKLRQAALACAFLLVFFTLGYSVYTHVSLRADARPPLNMMRTSAAGDQNLLSYLHTSPLTAVREASEATDVPASPSLRRQVGHFYTRYLFWNVVGRASDVQDAPVAWFDLSDRTREKYLPQSLPDHGYPVYFYILPFLLALFGLVVSIRSDWRSGIVLLTAFLSLGPVSAVVWGFGSSALGESEGLIASSLLPVAVWIGLGATQLARIVRERSGEENDEDDRRRGINLAGGVLALCFILVPLNLFYNGLKTHDRSENELAHDFAWNLLQSCDSNAILFVDDTSPLRHAQDVEGVRRDVRVVDLRLARKRWYRDQIVREPIWDAEAIPATLAEGVAIGEIKGEPLIKGARFQVITSDSIRTVVLSRPEADTAGINDSLLWYWQGETNDSGQIVYNEALQLIRAIVEGNEWKRPIYFAMTVDPSLWGGLQRFFRWEGLAFRVVPENDQNGIDGYSEFPIDELKMNTFLSTKFRSNGLTSDRAAFSPMERTIVPLYRRIFIASSAWALKDTAGAEARASLLLDRMDALISIETFPLSYWDAAAVASLYSETGNRKGMEKYARHAIAQIERTGNAWRDDPIARRFNPHQTEARMWTLLGDYERAIQSYRQVERAWLANPVVRGLVEELQIERHFAKGDTAAGIAELRKIIESYATPNDPGMRNNLEAWMEMLEELEGKPDRTEED